MRTARPILYWIIRASGGFSLARYLTRKRLRILCYHGFSTDDEHLHAPYVFMRPATFERRMRILKKWRIPVLPLENALERLGRGRISNAETVITFDDGWATTLTVGVPILKHYGFPATLYVTTEHLEANPFPVDVALSYAIAHSRNQTLKLRGVHPALDGDYDLATDRDHACEVLRRAAAKILPLSERQSALRPIALALGVDPDDIIRHPGLRLLERAEIRQISSEGIDVQMHTHSHRLPDDSFEATRREIDLNREALKDILGCTSRHFCYPSGAYRAAQPQWLSRLGVLSAVTCDAGMNTPKTSLMLLRRYLDSELQTDIEFEAEVVGVCEILRLIRAAAYSVLGRLRSPESCKYQHRS